MKNKSLFLFATISPKDEYFVKAKEALLNMIEDTRKEEGCKKFDLHDDGKQLYLYEEWLDELSLHQHHEKEYTKEVFEKYKTWLKKPTEIVKMFKSFNDK